MLMGVRTGLLQTGVVAYSAALGRFRRRALCQPSIRSSPRWARYYILKGVEAAILAGVGNAARGAGRRGSFWALPRRSARSTCRAAFSDAYGLIFLVGDSAVSTGRAVRERHDEPASGFSFRCYTVTRRSLTTTSS